MYMCAIQMLIVLNSVPTGHHVMCPSPSLPISQSAVVLRPVLASFQSPTLCCAVNLLTWICEKLALM